MIKIHITLDQCDKTLESSFQTIDFRPFDRNYRPFNATNTRQFSRLQLDQYRERFSAWSHEPSSSEQTVDAGLRCNSARTSSKVPGTRWNGRIRLEGTARSLFSIREEAVFSESKEQLAITGLIFSAIEVDAFTTNIPAIALACTDTMLREQRKAAYTPELTYG